MQVEIIAKSPLQFAWYNTMIGQMFPVTKRISTPLNGYVCSVDGKLLFVCAEHVKVVNVGTIHRDIGAKCDGRRKQGYFIPLTKETADRIRSLAKTFQCGHETIIKMALNNFDDQMESKTISDKKGKRK